jgi:hypothetical protein
MCAEDMVDTTWSSVDGRMSDEKARPARNNAYYGRLHAGMTALLPGILGGKASVPHPRCVRLGSSLAARK